MRTNCSVIECSLGGNSTCLIRLCNRKGNSIAIFEDGNQGEPYHSIAFASENIVSVVSVLNGNAGCRIDNEPLLTPEGAKAVPVVTPIIVYDATDCIMALRPYGGTQIFGRYSHFRNIGAALMHNSKMKRE
ncbi:hypothetical protein NPIL_576881 [Nephila pilipes]|uniref:Uncharacterized protein n=1 Tax=Nephila pilipes TaxID=299642 RepID=A0A8X6TDU7_NEPPI|nr:hypothetical protein NPIL_576881 [Nephila pilipes]